MHNIMKYSIPLTHLLLQITLLFSCNGNFQMHEDSSPEKNCAEIGPGQKGSIQLAGNNEPGEPLVIYGKTLDRKTNRPVKNVSIFLYQTDSSGIYSTSGRDEDARIRGTVYTNESGCFKIKTILPGDYPGRKNSRHLHYVINAKGYSEKKSILFFQGFTTENITGQGPLIVLDIRKDSTGTWIGSTDFYLE
jgi:protocatechuate 3,4-dioxygenase beta subunit